MFLWAAVLVLAVLVVGLLRVVGSLQLRVEELARTVAQTRVRRVEHNGLPQGAPAPVLRLLDHRGSEVGFAPAAGRRTVVVLSQPGCVPCERLMPELGRVAVRERGTCDIVVISRGEPGGHAVPPGVRVLYQRDAEAMAAFRAFASPWVFVVGPDGLIEAQGIAGDPAELRRLLTARRPGPPSPSDPDTRAEEASSKNGPVGTFAD